MKFIADQTEQKLRGGYYTPVDLAAFAARWALAKGARDVLEPSCGDGRFFRAIASVDDDSAARRIAGFELLPSEAQKARVSLGVHGLTGSVVDGDFLEWALPRLLAGDQLFDAVVGNPPFIRYQFLRPSSQLLAEKIFSHLELPFTRHTNAWVPFVLASVAILRPGGRLAMILPAEIIHVMHAQSLRTFLAKECSRCVIIDPEELWFESTLQGAVILLAEKAEPSSHHDGVGILSVRGRSFLAREPSSLFERTPTLNGVSVAGKWTWALLSSRERDSLRQLSDRSDVHSFASVAKTSVGIVTGANKFFLVPDELVEQHKLKRFAHPMFGRSEHCAGVIYDERQQEENKRKGFPTNFLWITAPREKLPRTVLTYIESGEAQKLHTRFKCRIREPWYEVPHVYASPVGMLKRSHDAPRLILNRLGALTTDTAYRIEPKVSAEKLVFCFMNSLTALTAELEGRYYGGGVLELVPSEIARLLVPLPAGMRPAVRALDDRIRCTSIRDVLQQQDDCILVRGLKLERSVADDIASAWHRLRSRRQRSGGDLVDLEDK